MSDKPCWSGGICIDTDLPKTFVGYILCDLLWYGSCCFTMDGIHAGSIQIGASRRGEKVPYSYHDKKCKVRIHHGGEGGEESLRVPCEPASETRLGERANRKAKTGHGLKIFRMMYV